MARNCSLTFRPSCARERFGVPSATVCAPDASPFIATIKIEIGVDYVTGETLDMRYLQIDGVGFSHC